MNNNKANRKTPTVAEKKANNDKQKEYRKRKKEAEKLSQSQQEQPTQSQRNNLNNFIPLRIRQESQMKQDAAAELHRQAILQELQKRKTQEDEEEVEVEAERKEEEKIQNEQRNERRRDQRRNEAGTEDSIATRLTLRKESEKERKRKDDEERIQSHKRHEAELAEVRQQLLLKRKHDDEEEARRKQQQQEEKEEQHTIERRTKRQLAGDERNRKAEENRILQANRREEEAVAAAIREEEKEREMKENLGMLKEEILQNKIIAEGLDKELQERLPKWKITKFEHAALSIQKVTLEDTWNKEFEKFVKIREQLPNPEDSSEESRQQSEVLEKLITEKSALILQLNSMSVDQVSQTREYNALQDELALQKVFIKELEEDAEDLQKEINGERVDNKRNQNQKKTRGRKRRGKGNNSPNTSSRKKKRTKRDLYRIARDDEFDVSKLQEHYLGKIFLFFFFLSYVDKIINQGN